MPRISKYNEKTESVTFKVPKSKIEDFKKLAGKILKTYEKAPKIQEPNQTPEPVQESAQKIKTQKIDRRKFEENAITIGSATVQGKPSDDIPKEATKANANYLKIKGISNVYKWSEGNIYKAQVFKNRKLNVEYFMTLDAAQTFLNSL